MNITLPTALASAMLAALAASALAAPASAQESFPRLVGGADDLSVEYGPGPVANIVGGGAVRIVNEEEGRVSITHADPAFAQGRHDGRVPVMLGGEADHSITWIAPNAGSLRAGRAGRPQG